jgi:hypothetical protein
VTENFNPFGKNIDQLSKDDLQILVAKQVAEGWYVEYKSAFPSNLKVARSLAAFANTDGGWYIVGVECGPGNVAANVCGFDSGGLINPKDKLRDIVRGHIQPAPRFESILIELDPTRAVLIVYVESGNEAPYITSDGRIYRRVGEGSEPIPETDRFALEKLFGRQEALRKRVTEFCTSPFIMSAKQADSKQCFLECFFWVAPFGGIRFADFHSKEFIVKLRETFRRPVPVMIDEVKMSGSMENFSSSGANSYILRQTPRTDEGIDHLALGLTLEIFPSGNMRLVMPVSQIPVDSKGIARRPYDKSIHFPEFLNLLSGIDLRMLRIVDGYALFATIAIVFGQYRTLLASYAIGEGLNAKFRLKQCWRVIPYFDNAAYIDFLKEYGLPIGLVSENEMPAVRGVGLPIELDHGSTLGITYNLYAALGMPLPLVADSMKGFGRFVLSIVNPKLDLSSLDDEGEPDAIPANK